MALWNQMNVKPQYTKVLNYIFEYDLSKANINALLEHGKINQETYNRLYNAPRMERQVYVGNMIRDDSNIYNIIQSSIIKAKQNLFESNGIKDEEILCIKNDAVFMISRKLTNTKFNHMIFNLKNTYTAFYHINGLEFYYYKNKISEEEILDIKGINDEKLYLHRNGMLDFVAEIFSLLDEGNLLDARQILVSFYEDYLHLKLPVEYYRSLDNYSNYRLRAGMYTYSINVITEKELPFIDIEPNRRFLQELFKIIQ